MEFALISIVFLYNIKNKLLRQVIRIVPVFLTLFSIYDYWISPSDRFSYKPVAAECLILLIYIIYFFYEKIQTITLIPVYQTKIFWIAVAFIIYSSGNFFLFLYANNAIKDDDFNFQYTLVYSTFAILKNIALSVGILIDEPDSKSNQYPDLITQNSFSDSIGLDEESL